MIEFSTLGTLHSGRGKVLGYFSTTPLPPLNNDSLYARVKPLVFLKCRLSYVRMKARMFGNYYNVLTFPGEIIFFKPSFARRTNHHPYNKVTGCVSVCMFVP